MNFPYNIPSIDDIHPDLANEDLDHDAFQVVNVVNAIGTPINTDVVIDAESAVNLLLGARSGFAPNSFSTYTTNILFREIPRGGDRTCRRNGKEPGACGSTST